MQSSNSKGSVSAQKMKSMPCEFETTTPTFLVQQSSVDTNTEELQLASLIKEVKLTPSSALFADKERQGDQESAQGQLASAKANKYDNDNDLESRMSDGSKGEESAPDSQDAGDDNVSPTSKLIEQELECQQANGNGLLDL